MGLVHASKPAEVIYPETDNIPVGESSTQHQWICQIFNGLEGQYAHDPMTAVHSDLFWYPVQGNPKIVLAPDVMVIQGVPKIARGSYLQWAEGNVVPQVVFEIQSPSNKPKQLKKCFDFYQQYGVLEYYLYEPLGNSLAGWQRVQGRLTPISQMNGWVSPTLNIRFEQTSETLHIYGSNGGRFLTLQEHRNLTEEQTRLRVLAELSQREEERKRIEAERGRLVAEQKRVLAEHKQREEEKKRIEEEQKRIEEEQRRIEEEQRRIEEEQRRIEEEQKAKKFAAKLRELGINPDDLLQS